MRVIGEIAHPECKVSIFRWNQKYLVKIEKGMCEQTFKIAELDVESEDDLKSRISTEFISKALTRFKDMQNDLNLVLG